MRLSVPPRSEAMCVARRAEGQPVRSVRAIVVTIACRCASRSAGEAANQVVAAPMTRARRSTGASVASRRPAAWASASAASLAWSARSLLGPGDLKVLWRGKRRHAQACEGTKAAQTEGNRRRGVNRASTRLATLMYARRLHGLSGPDMSSPTDASGRGTAGLLALRDRLGRAVTLEQTGASSRRSAKAF
jgi:hypothetical protein